MTACGGYRHNDGGRHHKIQEICYELVRIIFSFTLPGFLCGLLVGIAARKREEK